MRDWRKPKSAEPGCHQQENQGSAITPIPATTRRATAGRHEEAPDEQAGDGHRHGHGPYRYEPQIEPSKAGFAGEKARAECGREVIEGGQRERAETPEDEGVGDAGQGRAGRSALPCAATLFPKELA